MKIFKRDGQLVDFDKNKIKNAVLAAFKDVDGEVSDYAIEKAENIANYVEEKGNKENKTFSVEEIQDMVEQGIMATKRKDVAKTYVRYRYKKEIAREKKDDFIKAIFEKLNATNIQNQNANVDEASFGGRLGEAASYMTKQLALDYLVSETARNNHLNNEIYIHDLDSYILGSHNCLSIPFDDLLAKGFNTRQTDVRPANSINTAFQLVAVIFQLQSLQQFGGVSATHLDWTMVPYIRKSFYKHWLDGWHFLAPEVKTPQGMFEIQEKGGADKVSIEDNIYKITNYSNFSQSALDSIYNYALEMTKKELKQGAEGLYHNLNTLQSRSGNQLD